ncbi:GntR family transcriptional regulator [Arcanobacterium phocisimile]|uniref:GntR family transcriptional regulator n=1 Tax=Arcanobacterium phocisimile TaxID=1302235 RepID=A0ABX7IHK8_9ACTO|nr:GntR family transcriptional regulator [Arcanobacterium phocisimile]QRV02220.1 GntR family transcriptional regulator [Arcanobacterium phocisimile]
MEEKEPSQNLDTPFILDIKLNRHSTDPLYQQILEPISKLIKNGTLAPNQLLEDEISMAQRLQISRPTARRALQELVDSGLVVRRRGVGTRVTPSHVHRQLALTSLNDDLIKAGHTTRTEVLEYQIHLATPEDVEFLNCAPDEELVTIQRLRWIDDHPLALLKNTIPSRIAPTLTELSHFGLYESLSRHNVFPTSAIQTLGAKNASKRESDILNIEPGNALFTMQRTAYDENGKVIEHGNHVYDAQQYKMTFPLVSHTN